MPKLWSDTIDAHRQAVREAVMDATAALVAEQGLTSVTMSRIAERSGIGRATLYKHFPDVDSILTAWHERQVTQHLHQLNAVSTTVDDPTDRLAAVLHAYAHLTAARTEHHPPLAATLHQTDHVSKAHQHLAAFLGDLLTEAAHHGDIRTDVPPTELAAYCLHALAATTPPSSPEAVDRLVTVVLDGLRRHD